jgi:hypothetical protein
VLPERASAAIAQQSGAEFLGNGKSSQVLPTRTLDAKDREANIHAKPVRIEFDRIVAQAEALSAAAPTGKTGKRRVARFVAASSTTPRES